MSCGEEEGMKTFILLRGSHRKNGPGQISHNVVFPPAKPRHFGFGLLPFTFFFFFVVHLHRYDKKNTFAASTSTISPDPPILFRFVI